MSDDVCRRTPENDELNRVAKLLISEWERVERKPVNVSYWATFVDLARAAIADRATIAQARAEARSGQPLAGSQRQQISSIVLGEVRDAIDGMRLSDDLREKIDDAISVKVADRVADLVIASVEVTDAQLREASRIVLNAGHLTSSAMTEAAFLALAPRKRGYVSYMLGARDDEPHVPDEKCPYPDGSGDAEEWHAGQQAACRDAQDGDDG